MILLVDNYDSFVHNLARYLRLFGESVRVARCDAITVEEARVLGPSHIVVSTGPCTPAEAGVSTDLIRGVGATVPVLGVCLGHQCVAAAYGGHIVRSARPAHGRTEQLTHDGSDLFFGLPNPLRVTLYHSLVVDGVGLPEELSVTARGGSGEIMALRHRRHPVWGVQFHPEALLTEAGMELLANFLALGRGQPPETAAPVCTVPELTGAVAALP